MRWVWFHKSHSSPLMSGSAREMRSPGNTSGTPPTLVLITCSLQSQWGSLGEGDERGSPAAGCLQDGDAEGLCEGGVEEDVSLHQHTSHLQPAVGTESEVGLSLVPGSAGGLPTASLCRGAGASLSPPPAEPSLAHLHLHTHTHTHTHTLGPHHSCAGVPYIPMMKWRSLCLWQSSGMSPASRSAPFLYTSLLTTTTLTAEDTRLRSQLSCLTSDLYQEGSWRGLG